VIASTFFARAIAEVPEVGRDRDCKVTFGLARVLAFLAITQPTFYCRFLAALVRVAPAAVPAPMSLVPAGSPTVPSAAGGGGGGSGAGHTSDGVSRLMSLYGAWMQVHHAGAAGDPATNRNPHGIAKAWRWVARLLNMRPFPLAGTALEAMLVYTAPELQRAFGHQALRLLASVSIEFLPAFAAAFRGSAAAEMSVTVLTGHLGSRLGVVGGVGGLDARSVPLLADPVKGSALPHDLPTAEELDA